MWRITFWAATIPPPVPPTMTPRKKRPDQTDDSGLRGLSPLLTGRLRRRRPDVYQRLRDAAGRVHRRESACTVGPTGLVHEAYLRLPDEVREDPDAHMGRVYREMNQVLIARARSRNRQKRWGSAARVTLDDDRLAGSAGSKPEDRVHGALDLVGALSRLGRVSPRLREVVRLRFEVGLTVGQVSATLDVPLRTVERDLTKARGLLGILLREEPPLG